MTVKMEEGSSIKVSKEEENGGVLVAHSSLGAAPSLESCLVEAKAASTEHSSSTHAQIDHDRCSSLLELFIGNDGCFKVDRVRKKGKERGRREEMV